MIKFTLLFCTFVAISVVTQAQVYKTDSGTAVFISKVPLHSFDGKSNYLNGAINLSSKTVDFYIDLETLDTGNGKRDKDMRLTLETKTFPFAEFYGKLVSNFDSTSNKEQPVKVEGFFKIHGKEKEVTIEGSLQKVDKNLALKANWILNLIDYDIIPPSLLILKVDEEQEINISAILTKQSN
tara:strand:- start:18407 stop:18952 length:546 start_codon:yes stop_codon:yes gene_type:complete